MTAARAGPPRNAVDPARRDRPTHLVDASTSSTPTPAPWPCRRRCLLLESSLADNLPLFTLDTSLRGLRVTGLRRFPRGIRTRRSKSWPAARCRACSSRANRSPCRSITPACSSRGRSIRRSSSTARVHADDTDPVDWSSLQASLQPPGTVTARLVGDLRRPRRRSSATPGAATCRCSITGLVPGPAR